MSRPASRVARALWNVVLALVAEKEERSRWIKSPMTGASAVHREVHRAVCVELDVTRKNSRRKEDL